jgi:uncharacterized phiE125 gp8 family phage protein
MLDLRLLTPPSGDVVALDIARQHCRVGGTEEDVLLVEYIATAVQAVEDATGRALLPQVWEFRPAPTDCHEIRLPMAPVLSVQEVASLADDGTATVLPLTDYRAVLPSGPTCGRGGIYLSGGAGQGLRIRYQAGYRDGQIPSPLRSAVLLLTGSLYENREAESERSGAAARTLNTNPAYERLLAPYRLIG